ncbi:transposable element Tc3 transposase [Trichonephila clavipes]|nr:transposable element Tc3 transposase [Trichonephila clavipes]
MVWAGFMINGRTRLHVVANGTMTGQRYIDEVLLPHVRLFRGAVGDKFVFMDDNATCDRTLAVQDCLDREGIQRLVWPARSPDLNPIENVWDALGRQVAGRNFPPTNKNTLIRALTEEWDKLPQQLLDNVVQKTKVVLLFRNETQIGDETKKCRQFIALLAAEKAFTLRHEVPTQVNISSPTVNSYCIRRNAVGSGHLSSEGSRENFDFPFLGRTGPEIDPGKEMGSNETDVSTIELDFQKGGVGTSGQKRCYLYGGQAQNALVRPIVEKTITSTDTRKDTCLIGRCPDTGSTFTMDPCVFRNHGQGA